MRQQDTVGFLPIFGLILTQPQNLGSRIARAHGISDQGDHGVRSAEMLSDLVALLPGRGVVPELSGANDLVILVEDDQPVLLAAHSDAANLLFARAEFGNDFADGLFRGVNPILGILFHRAGWEIRDEPIGLLCGGEDFAGVPVQSDGLGALGAAVDSEENHGRNKFE